MDESEYSALNKVNSGLPLSLYVGLNYRKRIFI